MNVEWLDIIYYDNKIMIIDLHSPNFHIYPLLKNKVYVMQTFCFLVTENIIHKIISLLPIDYNYKKYFKFLVNSEYEANLIKHIVDPIIWSNAVTTKVNNPPKEVFKGKKEYDAIHIARASKFKRHWLTNLVENCYQVSIVPKYILKSKCKCTYQELCKHCIEDTLSEDDIYNLFKNNKNVKISFYDSNIYENIKKTKVGLIFSPYEGACYASLEYLLAGLPVISCPSKGGRDVYYNERNSIIVENPTPEKVKDAVKKAIQKLEIGEFIPEEIRKDAYHKVLFFQNLYFDLIDEILKHENIHIDTRKDIFKNKPFIRSFMKYQTYENTNKIKDIIDNIIS